MQQIKKYSKLMLLIVGISALNSCALFKGKNKCGECPTWSKAEVKVEKAIVRV